MTFEWATNLEGMVCEAGGAIHSLGHSGIIALRVWFYWGCRIQLLCRLKFTIQWSLSHRWLMMASGLDGGFVEEVTLEEAEEFIAPIRIIRFGD